MPLAGIGIACLVLAARWLLPGHIEVWDMGVVQRDSTDGYSVQKYVQSSVNQRMLNKG